jgi:hypothetical protein
MSEMKPYALLLLASCAAPDTVGIETGYGNLGSGSGGRPWLSSYDGESYWIGPYVEWSIGANANHRESIDVLRRIELENARRGSAPVPVVVTQPDAHEDQPVDKILLGVAAILTAIAVGIGVAFKKMGTKTNPEPD